MRLNALTVASFAILLSLVSVDNAGTAGGCGPGFHPNRFGRGVPNERGSRT
jgi:hypothetical protein